MSATVEPILKARNLRKEFRLDHSLMQTLSAKVTGRAPRMVRAVDDVSLDVMPGETVGIVGESGCGKSTLARILAGISNPNAGEFLYKGQPFSEILKDPKSALKLQMIFQDPQSSINPRLKVVDIIGEAPACTASSRATARRNTCWNAWRRWGLSPEFFNRLSAPVLRRASGSVSALPARWRSIRNC